MGTDTDRNFIERMTWDEVARHIGNGAAAILPVGAAAKEHGFHLPLNTDRIQAEWLASQLAERFDALIWPTLSYGYYPAFVAYAGSSSLSSATFEAVVHEIASGIVDHGCRKLFVLNTGISTLAPVERALARLDAGKVMHLRIHEGPRYRQAADRLTEQNHGSHSPNYSRSGSYGDPTLATSAKGEILLAAMLDDLREQVAAFVADGAAASQRSGTARSVSR